MQLLLNLPGNMATTAQLDAMYMDIAARIASMSVAKRAQVGAVIVRDDNIISYGWNGTPAGDDNTCEATTDTGELVTLPHVLHAESNSLMKLAGAGGLGSAGSTLYVTLSPCRECAKLIKQAKITRVIYRDQYRDPDGIAFLQQRGVSVTQIATDRK